MKYHTITVIMMWFVLGTGLAAAGTLTLHLEPSLDGKGDIRATSITDAKLSDFQGIFILNDKIYKAATITNGTAQFFLGDGDAGNRYIMINNLYGSDLIPTRIDPTKDIHQFMGQKLRVSVIGNISDPTYRFETFTTEQGKHPTVSYYDGNYSPEVLDPFYGNIYTVLSLKTNPSFHVITLGAPRLGREQKMIDYTPTSPTHPSTSTSINPSFSKWMFGEGSHGNDYGGNDSKCSICHGNLDTKPSKFSEITVNNGFCFRCHYGKGGSDKGFVVDTIGLGIGTPVPTTAKQTTVSYTPVTPTVIQTVQAGPKAPGFSAVIAVISLLVVMIRRRKI